MVYSLENEIKGLDGTEFAISVTMSYIQRGKENIPIQVEQLLQDLSLKIPVSDIINSARQNLENPRCCSDG